MLDLARLVTMNTELLKELPVEDVLAVHPLIDTTELPFQVCYKVKPIKAKPISTILNDESVFSKIVIATLEGHETVKANSYVCWGIDNDVWQQTEKKLHDKYIPTHVDPDGWVHYEPKPDTPVNGVQITSELAGQHGLVLGAYGGFAVINPTWGDRRIVDGKAVYLQYGILNDYVMQGIGDATDLYRVARKFWDNTYSYEQNG